MDIFFQKLDNTLSTIEKEKIRECPDVGCLIVLVQSNMREKFSDAYEAAASHIDQFFIDSLKIDSVYDRQRFMLLAYQKKITGKKLDLVEIKSEIAQFDKLQDSIYAEEDWAVIRTQIDTAKLNFDRFQTNDTLFLELPLRTKGTKKVAAYFNGYNKNNFTDTLFVKAILIKKTKEKTEQSNHTYYEYFFSVKILIASNTNINLVDNLYRSDSIITIPLNAYGRFIKK